MDTHLQKLSMEFSRLYHILLNVDIVYMQFGFLLLFKKSKTKTKQQQKAFSGEERSHLKYQISLEIYTYT